MCVRSLRNKFRDSRKKLDLSLIKNLQDGRPVESPPKSLDLPDGLK